ncbi:MAG TPA: glycosyltransferase [Chloroflexota bacterium]|nr:glycosyltransferase [Chloroflexota bacterium]
MIDSRLIILYGIGQLTIGGAERQLYELVTHIDANKYRPLVFTLSDGGHYLDLLRQHHVPVIELTRKTAYDPGPIWKIAQILRRENVQVLHTFGFYAGLYGRLATYLSRPPLVISSERATHAWTKRLHNSTYFAIDRILARRTDVFIANAEAVRQFAISEKGLPPERMVVVYNGIDSTRFNHIPANSLTALNDKYGFLLGEPVIGIIARLDPIKDHQTFLQAAKDLLNYHPQAKFLIVGDGPLRTELEAMTDQLGIRSSVYFAGTQHGNDLIQHMARMDVVVSTSKGEGCSNSVLEAMCMEKALVVTDVGGNPELVCSGETGVIVPVADSCALTQAIATLLNNEEMRIRMGQNAREHVQRKFSISRMVAETTQIYEQKVASLPK